MNHQHKSQQVNHSHAQQNNTNHSNVQSFRHGHMTSQIPSDIHRATQRSSENGERLTSSDVRQRNEFWNTVLTQNVNETDNDYSEYRERSNQSNTQKTQYYSTNVPISADTSLSSSISSLSSPNLSMKKESPCPYCNAQFKRRYDLIQHVSAVHQKNRPYSCPVCEQAFAHKGTLSKHIRTVHRRERPYMCEHCGQRFSERGNVNKHKQRSAHCRQADLLKTSSTATILSQGHQSTQMGKTSSLPTSSSSTARKF